ncbi:MAG: MoaD/ThiS family protein [Chloroflexi bacterium]|nr:MoaD/ThiS family protein [Chloroflexota bacterium]
MRLYLGGHLNYFDAHNRVNLEIELVGKQRLVDILDSLKIPKGEVFLVSINGEVVSLKDAWIKQDDQVQLYPPMGGG